MGGIENENTKEIGVSPNGNAEMAVEGKKLIYIILVYINTNCSRVTRASLRGCGAVPLENPTHRNSLVLSGFVLRGGARTCGSTDIRTVAKLKKTGQKKPAKTGRRAGPRSEVIRRTAGNRILIGCVPFYEIGTAGFQGRTALISH